MTTLTRQDLKEMGYTEQTTGQWVKARVNESPPNGVPDGPLTWTIAGDGPRYRSKWEAERAEYWEAAKRAGFIRSWRYEPLRLRLADGAYYKPDFLVEMVSSSRGELILEEVKGFWREAAKVRFKVARELFPMFTFSACTKRNGQWVSAL